MYITTVHQCCTAEYIGAQMIIKKAIGNVNTTIGDKFPKLSSFCYDSKEYLNIFHFLVKAVSSQSLLPALKQPLKSPTVLFLQLIAGEEDLEFRSSIKP